MKIKMWISKILTTMFALLLIILATTVIISKVSGKNYNFFGYELKIVLSGSMEPTFLTGSVIAIRIGGDMTKFHPGDVITFWMKENTLVTHRIVEVINEGEKVMYRTKGDHNNSSDRELVSSQQVIGQYTGFTIPSAGYFFSYLSTKIGSALLLIIPGLLLILNSTVSLWKEFSKIEEHIERPVNIK